MIILISHINFRRGSPKIMFCNTRQIKSLKILIDSNIQLPLCVTRYPHIKPKLKKIYIFISSDNVVLHNRRRAAGVKFRHVTCTYATRTAARLLIRIKRSISSKAIYRRHEHYRRHKHRLTKKSLYLPDLDYRLPCE